MRRTLLFLGCATALVATGVRPAASSPPPYPNVSLVPADGSSSGTQVLIGAWGSSVSWSPDGGAVASGSEHGGITIAWLAGGWRDLTQRTADSDPAWSPDGERIVFVRSDWEADVGLFVVEADGGEAVPFAEAPGADLAPSWSPDGSRVAYYHRPPGADDMVELRVAPSDGSSHRVVAGGAIQTLSPPDWDPTGTSVAFTMAGPDGSLDVYAVTADGATLHRVAGGEGDQLDPDWSPDGFRIAFWGPEGIMVTDAAGTSSPLLLRAGGNSPSWSPDGERIAFDDGYDIMTIGSDGTDERTLVASPWRPANSPEWSPSGDSIAYISRWLDSRNLCDGLERNTVKSLSESGWLFTGDDGEDLLEGTSERDLFCAFDGNDRVLGDRSSDYVLADAGDDLVRGGEGDDSLYGDGTGEYGGSLPAGDDSLHGGRGDDLIGGGPGDDVLRGGPGRDHIRGGRGHDVCYVRAADKVADCEVLRTPAG